MAGPHQIWKLDLEAGTIGVWAGIGPREHRRRPARRRPRSPSRAAWRPTARHLFVADSEVSGVRVDHGLDKRTTAVGTIVGEGLFEFGDVDGTGAEVRLQHCLGVAYGDGKLYIADTYNNKIKVCDPQTRTVEDPRRRRRAGRRATTRPGSTSPAA